MYERFHPIDGLVVYLLNQHRTFLVQTFVADVDVDVDVAVAVAVAVGRSFRFRFLVLLLVVSIINIILDVISSLSFNFTLYSFEIDL